MDMPTDDRREIMYLYCIFDRVAEKSGPVFVQMNDACASREFRMAQQNARGIDAEDYQLMRLGTWDPHKCLITVEDVPLVVHVAMPTQAFLPGLKEG